MGKVRKKKARKDHPARAKTAPSDRNDHKRAFEQLLDDAIHGGAEGGQRHGNKRN